MNREGSGRLINILLVEDNPGDVRLALEAWKEAKVLNEIKVVEDGETALAYLHKEGEYVDVETPDLILLDLTLPRMDGRELLKVVKEDPELRRIPVVVLTVSQEEKDVLLTYNLHANCYIVKPADLDQFIEVIRSIEGFWLSIVKLPEGA
jgi:two-component system, chemotaxis family, response regulator Rcp1